jgi:hypothetical protein
MEPVLSRPALCAGLERPRSGLHHMLYCVPVSLSVFSGWCTSSGYGPARSASKKAKMQMQ